MKGMIRSILLATLCVACAPAASCYAGQVPDGAIERVANVIILVWNGVRYADSIGDPSAQYIPHLRKDLMPEGSLFTHMYDSSYEFHVSTVVAMLSGNLCHHFTYELQRVLPEFPTLFQYARKKYGGPASQYWEIGTFGAYTAFSESKDFGENTRPCVLRASLFPHADEIDKLFSPELMTILDKDEKLSYETMAKNKYSTIWDTVDEVDFRLFKKVMRVYKPKLMLFNVNSLDIAHGAHWAKYIAALRRSDEITWEIWKSIQEDPHYRDNTYLIVTADHERNRYFMHHTEQNNSHPSHVWAYIFGPDVARNKVIDRKVDHVDVCRTVARMMDFDASYCKGAVLQEAFVDQVPHASAQSLSDRKMR